MRQFLHDRPDAGPLVATERLVRVCAAGWEDGWMRKFLMILGGLLVLAALIGIPIGLYFLGEDEQSSLERWRDVAIIMFGILLILSTLLFATLIGILIWVALKVKDKVTVLFDDKISPLMDDRVSPLLATLNDTAGRVKGTTEFMTEEAAAPVISFYGTIARARAMTRVVTGRDKDRGQGTIKRLLKR
jgi:MFS family permease